MTVLHSQTRPGAIRRLVETRAEAGMIVGSVGESLLDAAYGREQHQKRHRAPETCGTAASPVKFGCLQRLRHFTRSNKPVKVRPQERGPARYTPP